mmetsp:Transcript_6620/g.14452  ORF Transcript_6620/g.14452 Transcript_6620/m.14452 type:complete len:128 (+) Transcript_6620:1852-2235(+)
MQSCWNKKALHLTGCRSAQQASMCCEYERAARGEDELLLSPSSAASRFQLGEANVRTRDKSPAKRASMKAAEGVATLRKSERGAHVLGHRVVERMGEEEEGEKAGRQGRADVQGIWRGMNIAWNAGK